jgi:hypothetical protein
MSANTTTDVATKVHAAAQTDRNVYCVALNYTSGHRVQVAVGGVDYTFDYARARNGVGGHWVPAYRSGWGGWEPSDYRQPVTDRAFIDALEKAVVRRMAQDRK